MINEVRNAVMFILNKDNNGYLTPSEFNSFSKLAQIEIFEDTFQKVNDWHSKRNIRGQVRQSNSGIADITKHVTEDIEFFVNLQAMTYNAGVFEKPSDIYSIVDVIHSNNSVEKVSNHKIIMLNNSSLTSPSVFYPAYVERGDSIVVHPDTITTGVSAMYVRLPEDPNWTYYTDPFGNPVYDENNALYKDFELSQEYMPELVLRILAKAGVTLREADIINVVNSEEAKNAQKEQ
jgi:hypothetical protein